MVIRRALGGAVLWIAGVLAGTARSGDLTAIPLVPATMPTQNANFGNTILLSDELIAVGAPFDGPQNEGSVYFFEPSDTNASGWTNTGKISLPDADVEGAFGVSLEMTQNSLFVGASYMDLAAMRSGAVYVYDKTTGTESGWTLKQRITPTDGRYGLAFGQSIAVADDTLFISGPYQDPSRSGRVYVYQRDSQANDDWVLQGSLEPSRLTGDLFFGEDIDIYQNTLAVTAWGERSVYIFDRNAENTTQWDLTQVIKSSGNERYFGMSVDIDQNRLAVGSGRSDRGITGMTYVFEKQDGRWQEVAKLTAPVPARADMFGADVAFDGAELYVGAAHYQSSDPAVVYRFHTEGDLSNWQLAGEMIAPNAQPYEGFGGEIEALNGMLAVGASGRGEFGVAYLYTYQSAAIPGDFNHDGVLDWADIDLWDAAVRQSVPDPSFDLNGDADIDSADRAYWVRELRGTWIGDANLDRLFDTADLVAVSSAGQYEDDIAANSRWATGDFDGDGDFSSADLVAALADGGYEQGPRVDPAAVPEPTREPLVAVGALVGFVLRKRRNESLPGRARCLSSWFQRG